MSAPFRVTAVFSTTPPPEDAPDPIGQVRSGQIDLRHIDCAGGRCNLEEGMWEDRQDNQHNGYLIRCTVCGDTSRVRTIMSLVQQIRRAVIENEKTSHGGWVEMQGDPARSKPPSSKAVQPPATLLAPELVRLHFADGGTRDMLAAKYLLRHGNNSQTYLHDADGKEVGVYAPGVVLAIEVLRAYPADDA